MTDQENLGELISRAVAERMSSDFVQKIVLERVDKLITDAVDSALRSYSDTGKTVTKAVEEALKVNKLDLPSYGSTVAAMLKVQIEARVSELVSGRLAADMEEILGLAPKEVRLSALVAEMVENSSREYGECVSCIVETTEYDSAWVYLDEQEPNLTRRDCDITLLVSKDGKISSATIGGKSLKDTTSFGRNYGIGQKLRALYACGSKIILDESAVVLGKGDY